MKRNSRIIQDDEIDLKDIIKTLWNEKILILSISLFFMVVGYVYGALQPKIYKTEITIREAPPSLFEAYSGLLGPQPQDIAEQFNNDLELNLSSLDTLVQFVEETNTINDFKNHLKEKNISPRNYFRGKFVSEIYKTNIIQNNNKKNNIQNRYYLTYSQPLPGPSFLNDYIVFVKQQTVTTFKKQLKQTIINQLNIHQDHLEIAKKIDLDNPILQSAQDSRSVVNEPEALFYKGTKVLSQQITYLNKQLNETKNLTLDYKFILEQASSESLISKSSIIYSAFALLIGIFLSFIAIFFKVVFKKEKCIY